ncbi:Microtubule-associated protein RP/EB family member 1 [Auxenochlorella protothecoides]|uniref:Microtubule-associated protein RP/EB family member 1 n=1 Tax=Auxenochlorella protothecoides TaxID=3075 RepID=A0A087SRB4_AUXPR|nr:Microtubule-associated protein RP/EB family member 1 [Auxenochlorella protothecoides]KFM28268.1 Microtubule-associated protein RP/EB family member 1 [Auxenochlorella protothecoides]
MRKVDFNVRNDYEFVGNYKELQQAFNKHGIDRAFNVAALSKGKLQDNNEFMQWFKGYWDSVTGGLEIDDYDALARRQSCKTGDWKKWSAAAPGAAPRPAARASSAAPDTIAAYRRGSAAPAARASSGLASNAKSEAKAALLTKAELSGMTDELGALRVEVEDLKDENEDLRAKLHTLEHERDFYFNKLRDVEILCQWPEVAAAKPVVEVIENILFAADAEEGKQVMEEAATRFAATPTMAAEA